MGTQTTTTTWPRIFTAMVTPFAEDGSLDLDKARNLARFLIAHGTDGIIVAATTGESPTLSLEERRALFEAVAEVSRPLGVPVWVGTGTNDTRASIRLTEAADSWGADGMLVVTPYYNKPPQEGLYRHFRAVAASTTRPVMLYNVPGRTGVNLAPETALNIMHDQPNVLAIKEASGSVEAVARLVAGLPEGARVYSGDDGLYYPTLALGGWGVVSVASHVAGPQMAAIWQAVTAGDWARAQALHQQLLPLFKELFVVTNPIPVKWALNYLGIPVGDVRLPLVTPPDRTFARLAGLLDAVAQPAAAGAR
ncbi:4-hydroxy-tetrahydrodipicolinate synthase [Candidatus Hydrogenisulfobacillus filiaventi]|uniref:4-hydroxy-tetrahydrodipicolinate synthase n=1 Tax=Candidatus Hydrogenisulfobacillus filiaventi TaxID=2707344 RepID=A0A6F8ZJQ1_9FIRM|nr:4-hydroxy-tetrahydrodipicolinate synthase [Bacillota bacterium]CAB1130018.1 4-hydroxy-tetrahydrodipicolinate synthase [Candidatus Hydrogenisulfobacillus filiaventi]